MHKDDIEIALTYHDETNHTFDSVYRTHHFLDWDNQPLPYKHYPTLEPIPLPTSLPTTGKSLFSLGSAGRDEPAQSAQLTLAELAYLLFYAAGVTRRRTYPDHGELHFRAAACTGALYHIDLYVVAGDLPDLAAGLYHFDPINFALRQLRAGDYRPVLVDASGGDTALAASPVTMVGTDTFWRNSWKYRARAYRHSFWDSGHHPRQPPRGQHRARPRAAFGHGFRRCPGESAVGCGYRT